MAESWVKTAGKIKYPPLAKPPKTVEWLGRPGEVSMTKPENVTLNAELSVTSEIICDICGEHFKANRKDAKYCSSACRKKASRNDS